jgi:uncharacterized protein YuzE
MATVVTKRRMSKDEAVRYALNLAKEVTKLGQDLWVSYDAEADVLYISLQCPQRATDTIMLDDVGILLSYRGRKLVGITVLEASKR